MLRGTNLVDAKRRLELPLLWQRLALPGDPKKSGRCPFHEDSKASFSVYRSRSGAWRWKCFAGCGGGDEIDLIARALDLPKPEACRRFLEMAGGGNINASCSAIIKPRPKPRRAPRVLSLPPLETGTRVDLRALGESRNVSAEGLALATERGLLRFANLRGVRAWIVTDPSRSNAQARRLDGRPWSHLLGQPKAWTLFGSRGSWPLGIGDVGTFEAAAIVEGGPDLLALCHFIVVECKASHVAPVAILGASNDLPPEVRANFSGRRVRLFPHLDHAGSLAAGRWADQLRTAGAGKVDALSFHGLHRANGHPVRDLNDLCFLDPEEFERERALWNLLP